MGTVDARRLAGLVEAVRRRRPLVHHMTNLVVANVTANLTLAAGAAPVMTTAPEEVEDVAARADALVLNVGTPSAPTVESMVRAGLAANAHGRPVVLDPVGYGFTRFRTEIVQTILAAVRVTVVRGNRGEIGLLAGADARVRGVDSDSDPSADGQLFAAMARFARERGCVVVATGEVDLLTDGRRRLRVYGGHRWLTAVTGTGCMATALIALVTAVAGGQPLEAAAAALGWFALAAERAAARSSGPGSFQAALLDAVHGLEPADIAAELRIEEDPE